MVITNDIIIRQSECLRSVMLLISFISQALQTRMKTVLSMSEGVTTIPSWDGLTPMLVLHVFLSYQWQKCITYCLFFITLHYLRAIDSILSNGCVKIFYKILLYYIYCTSTCIEVHDWGKNSIHYPQLIHYLGVSIICQEGGGLRVEE